MVKKLFFLLFLISTSLLQGYSYSGKHFGLAKKGFFKGPKQVICLSDVHMDNKVAFKQRWEVLGAAKALDAKVIVEDMEEMRRNKWSKKDWSNAEGFGYTGDCADFIANLGTGKDYISLDMGHRPLWGLTSFCRAADVAGESIEFRYYDTGLVDSLLNGSPENLCDFLKSSTEHVCKEIATYNDSRELNTYYRKTLNRFKNDVLNPALEYFKGLKKYSSALSAVLDVPLCKEIDQFLYNEQVIDGLDLELPETQSKQRAKNYIKNSNDEKLKSFIMRFCIWLLDMRILHAMENTDKDFVIIFAGGHHIFSISSMLEKLGYEETYGTEKNKDGYLPINLSQFFAKVYGDEFVTSLKPYMESVLNNIEQKLPAGNRAQTHFEMIKNERNHWKSVIVPKNADELIKMAQQRNSSSDSSGILDSLNSIIFPYDLTNTITLITDAGSYIFDQLAMVVA